MRVLLSLLFLTFVASPPLAQAAPSTQTTMPSAPLDAQPDSLLSDKEYLETNQKPPTGLVNVSFGYGGGNYLERDVYAQGSYLKLLYASLYRRDFATWDLAAEFNSEKNTLGLFWGYRWYFSPDDIFVPYSRISMGTFLEPKGELANFVDFERFRARASVGVGKTICTEAGVGYALTGVDIFVQTGLNFYF